MKLLIVESPSKAKTINQYLGKDFNVISSYGHIRGLPSAEGSVLPENNFQMIYGIMDRSEKHVSEIVKNAKKCSELYLATDPDREGEAISWHIAEVLKAKKAIKDIPIKRVVFHEITKKAILDAVSHPREIDYNLVHAQQARQALDYLYGFTLSPVLWRRLPGSRSAGRVQSVALRVICDRELEIEKFKSEEYWTISSLLSKDTKETFAAGLQVFEGKKLEKFSIQDAERAAEIKRQLLTQAFHVAKIEKKQLKRNPEPPFTTSTLLQEAARKLGYTAKKTSKIAQDLYEGMEVSKKTVGLITYMRTDSVMISDEALTAAREYISGNYGKNYLPAAPRKYTNKSKNAQEAHEAIRPTNIEYSPAEIKKFLDDDHFKLYELIWKRLVASQMESAQLEQVSIDIASACKTSILRAVGTTITFDGFYKLYTVDVDDKEDEDKQLLPKFTEGEHLDLLDVQPKQHFTQPPPRYTEASLVKKMEELGIGRPSTYPAIISILQERGYVIVDKKRFFPEVKGRLVSAFLCGFFTQYINYDFTAKLEDELDDIAGGKIEINAVLKEFWSPFKAKTEEALKLKISDIGDYIQKDLADMIFKDFPDDHKCPKCKVGEVSIKFGKYGPFLGCSSYPECNFIKQIASHSSQGEEDVPLTNEEAKYPKVLGDDDGAVISLRKGPYGLYVQKEQGKDIKRTTLPKGINPDTLSLTYALGLLALPRVVGEHPDGGIIKAGLGRFGPYIEYNKKFKSLKRDDPTTIDLPTAIAVLLEPTAPRRGKKS